MSSHDLQSFAKHDLPILDIPMDWHTVPPRLGKTVARAVYGQWSNFFGRAGKAVAQIPDRFPRLKANYVAYLDDLKANKPPLVSKASSVVQLSRDPEKVREGAKRAYAAMTKAKGGANVNRSTESQLKGFKIPKGSNARLVCTELSTTSGPRPRAWKNYYLEIPHPDPALSLVLRFKASAKAGAFHCCVRSTFGPLAKFQAPHAFKWSPLPNDQYHRLPFFIQDFLHRVSFKHTLEPFDPASATDNSAPAKSSTRKQAKKRMA